MKRKKKQGRVGRPKTSAAYRPRYDLGTPELAIKKATATAGQDPALSTTALDRLYAREKISAEQRQAGFRYLIRRQQIFGKANAKIGAYAEMIGEFDRNRESRTDEEQREIEDDFIGADKALYDAGRAAYKAARAIILDDKDKAPTEALHGLTALSRHWGLE